jgi:hypothetical protein
MFGNIKGWLAALLIVVIVYFVTLHSHLFPTGSEPSTQVQTEEFLRQHDITESIALVVGSVPNGAGNAADDYKQAIETYKLSMGQVRDFNRAWNRAEEDLKFDRENIREQLEDLRGEERAQAQQKLLDAVWAEYSLDLPDDLIRKLQDRIATGAKKKDMRYVGVHDGGEMNVHIETEQSSRLLQVAMMLQRVARYHIRKGEPDKVIDSLKNQVVLGWHMYNEHQDVETMMRGLQIQQTAMGMLEEIYAKNGDNAAIARMKPYADEIEALERYIREKRALVWFVLIQHGNPGDIYFIIDNDKDPAWRKRAVLSLGVLKHMPCLLPDKIIIRRKILKLCESDDPDLKNAAETARDFVRRDYRMLGAPRFPNN